MFFFKKRLEKEIPSPGKVDFGDFCRTSPFSNQFGYDRGGPVDRYYIENFLAANKKWIFGRVLEIGDNEYTFQYGGSKVQQSDILHVNDGNPKATFIGDLTNAPSLPDESFDCIVLTQTLHLIYEYHLAIKTCYRILKPGGALILTVPGISHIDKGEWGNTWFWSFTRTSIQKILAEVFPTENLLIENYGNVHTASAFLYGLGLPELDRKTLDVNDSHYQVIIAARAIK